MRKLLHLILCAVLALTLAIGLAACGGDGNGDDGSGQTNQGNDQNNGDNNGNHGSGGESGGETDDGDDDHGGDVTETVLTVPQGVRVDGNTLVWTAVENAAGYTVKINSDETTSVTATSLDLTTVTAKLAEGENSLAVKAKGEGNYKDSEYSTAVTYVYTAPETTSDAVKAFIEKVNAIGTLAQTDTQAEAVAISTVISEAEAAFGALSDEDKTAAEDAKAALDAKKQAYTEQTEAASAAHSAYASLIAAAKTEAEKKGSATKLETAISAVKAAKEGLSTLAGGLVTEGENADLATLESTLSAWKSAIVAATEALGKDFPVLDPDDDATAETILVEVAPILAAYEAYDPYIKENGDVAEKLAAVNAAKQAAQAQLDASVEALKDAIDEALTSKTEVTLENYDALIALQTRSAALGAYARQQFGDYKKAELQAVIDEMQKTPGSVETHESVFYNNNSDEQPVMYVTVNYKNFAGENIALEEAPAVTASETVTGGAETPIEPTISFHEGSMCYVVKFAFIRLAYNSDEETRTSTLTYQIGEEAEVTLVLASPRPIVYFNGSTSEAYNDAGTFAAYGASSAHETLVDVYLDEDIVKGENNATVELKGAPVASGTSKTLRTQDDLRHALAQNGVLGDRSVKLLAYQRWEEDGKLYITAINSASVSASVVLEDIEAQEANARLPQLGTGTIIRDDGSVLAVMPGDWLEQLGALFQKETFERADAAEYVRFHVYVSLNDDTMDFYAPMPAGGDTAITASIMKLNIYSHFNAPEATGYTVRVCLALAEGSEFADSLRESYPVEREWEHTATAEDTKLQPNLTDGKWDLGEPDGHINYKWELVSTDQDLHDGALIKIYSTKGITDVETHDFSSETPFAVYTIRSFTYVSWKTKNGDNLALDEVIRSAFVGMLRDGNVSLEDVEYEYSFVFAIQLVPNEAAEALGYTASDLVYATKEGQREVKDYTFTEDDIMATNAAQVRFPQNDYLQFLRSPSAGAVFTEYNAAYIELKITNADGESKVAYILLTADENGDMTKVILSANVEGTGATLDLQGVKDSFCTQGDFNNWVNETFGWSGYSVSDVNCKLNTRVIVSEESAWLYDGKWSDDVVAPTAE